MKKRKPRNSIKIRKPKKEASPGFFLEKIEICKTECYELKMNPDTMSRMKIVRRELTSDEEAEWGSTPGVERFQCPPVAFELPSEEMKDLVPTMSLKELRSMCMRHFSVHMLGDMVTYEQRREIAQHILYMPSDNCCSIRRFSSDEQTSYYTHLQQSIAKGTPVKEDISKKPFLTFCVTFPGYRHADAVPGQVVAIFYTVAKNKSPILSTQVIETPTVSTVSAVSHVDRQVMKEEIRQQMEEEMRQRMEKEIRQQMEDTIRKEMEEKMREEQRDRDQRQQLSELLERTKQHYKSTIDSIMQIPVRQAILQKMVTDGQSILIVSNIRLLDGDTATYPVIITTTGAYMLMKHHPMIEFSQEGPTEMLCPIYTFSAPLDIKQIHLIRNMFNVELNKRPVLYLDVSSYRAHFEAILRYIPGGYSNGAWKQLNGFFGPYLNEDTMELLAYAPPL